MPAAPGFPVYLELSVNTSSINWQQVRQDAERFPEAAFQFVREGLAYTVKTVHGITDPADEIIADARRGMAQRRTRHINGQQLSIGLRDFALKQYGSLAGTVMRKWGVKKTDDFGTIVYAMIDRKEMRASPDDHLDDFKNVFDFEEAFVEPVKVG